jgi:hypothetical protein
MDGLHECISRFLLVQPLFWLWTTFSVFTFIFGEWRRGQQLGVEETSGWRKGAPNRPRSRPSQSAWAHLGPVQLLLPPCGPSWHFAYFPKYSRHIGTISSLNKIEGLLAWTPIFMFRSSKMFRCSTLVLATFGSDFVLHLNTNETPLLLVWTWCVSVLFVRVFLQKHYTPKCTYKVELVISCISVPSGRLVPKWRSNQGITHTFGVPIDAH